MSFIQHADFGITSSSLKEVRNFCREIFKKNQELENEQEKLILVISEAVQNIIKHAYENKDSAEKNETKNFL
jgi:anti-sigma regulatory factor (Ser/Thr protein kinase)